MTYVPQDLFHNCRVATKLAKRHGYKLTDEDKVSLSHVMGAHGLCEQVSHKDMKSARQVIDRIRVRMNRDFIDNIQKK
jgi:4-hydroxy-3-methylbut-2-enyl diphosphate reductase IspH